MKKKVFASDFDGTIYFYKADVKLPPENVEKVKEYQEAGNLFGFCTGRQVGGLTPFIGGLIDVSKRHNQFLGLSVAEFSYFQIFYQFFQEV